MTAAEKAKWGKAAHPDGTCFVAMPFRDPFFGYNEKIYSPAIQAAGLLPTLASDSDRTSEILDDICALIKDARIVIAILSTENRNVVYELGVAHGLSKPVILVANTLKEVPSDLRSYRTILYDMNESDWGITLGATMTRALTETLANPAMAIPHPLAKRATKKTVVIGETKVSHLCHDREARARRGYAAQIPGSACKPPASFVAKHTGSYFKQA